MAVPILNNVATGNVYSEALTCVFSYPKPAFALNVFNAAIFYQLAIPGASGQSRDIVWDGFEHYLAPANTNFTDPNNEGFSGATTFAGVRIRSAVTGTPANVTVI